MKRTIIIVVVVAIIIAILAWLRPKPSADKVASSRPPAPKAIAVKMLVAKATALANLFYSSGNIAANEAVYIRNEMPGRVTKILFTEGGHVKKNDLLVKLNDDDLQAQLQKLQSSLKNAETDEKRQKQLLDINGISQQDYDNIVNTVNGMRADVENIKAQINKTEIRAPFDGVIGLRNVSVGSFLASGTTISSLQQLNPVKIDFSVPEKYASRIVKDAKIFFTVDGVADTFTATVYAGEPMVNAATGTVQFRAHCPNPGNKLLPGAFAHISVKLQTIENAIVVPSQAVVARQNAFSLYIAKNGKATLKPITIGIRTDSTVQVLGGLSLGDTVITSAIIALKEGSPVLPLQNTVK